MELKTTTLSSLHASLDIQITQLWDLLEIKSFLQKFQKLRSREARLEAWKPVLTYKNSSEVMGTAKRKISLIYY